MDPIADMLTIIRNAQAVKKETVRISYSKEKMQLAELLKREGYIKDAERKGSKKKPVIVASLKYNSDGTPAIEILNRVSKPGQRKYIGYRDIKPVKEGFGHAIISTPKGILTGNEAKKEKVGGEYMCEIW